LGDVINLARQHPAFFFELAVRAFWQVRKRYHVQG
jgi:hypothetical protein